MAIGDSCCEAENSVFVDPRNPDRVLVSNNDSNSDGLGPQPWLSTDGGATWIGGPKLPLVLGDPAAAIDRNGRLFVANLHSDLSATPTRGVSVYYSDDISQSFTRVIADLPIPPSLSEDRPHLWVDNSPSSPYQGRLYLVWRDGPEIYASRSLDNGASWTLKQVLSDQISAIFGNREPIVQTAANGHAYVAWSVNDNGALYNDAIGFARSTDGGAHWEAAQRIIVNIRDNFGFSLGGGKTMRHAPNLSMTVDPAGTLYVVWGNLGAPGVNSGDMEIYLIKSTDGGVTWNDESPMRVNQDPIVPGEPKDQWFPWIAADPASGNLVVIFYDSRNFPLNDRAETFVALSTNGGSSWQEMKVSDASWTADGFSGPSTYAGDYIGIDIQNGRVYPVWTDTSSGAVRTYASPFELDTDADGYGDAHDNCTLVANGVGVGQGNQVDADGDECGNRCDADFDNSGWSSLGDFNTFKTCFTRPLPNVGPPGGPAADPNCYKSDMNGSGAITIGDWTDFKVEFTGDGLPGPSAFGEVKSQSPCLP